MKTAYYAHCMALYGTPQEVRDVQNLEFMGFFVSNPNNDIVNAQCTEARDMFNAYPRTQDPRCEPYEDASAYIMQRIFRPLVQACDVFVFRALPDGRISSGVFLELTWAREFGKPVLELPSCVLSREMSLEETREYLAEVGQR